MTPLDKKATTTDAKVEEIRGRCVHFNGQVNVTCKAGVNYADVRLDHEPMKYRGRDHIDYSAGTSYPCLAKYNHGGATCPKREVLSVEDAKAKIIEDDASTALFLEGLKRCQKDAGRKRGIIGVVECPKCKGSLRYSVAAYNGHLWGKCDTPDCLAWMM